MASFTKTFSNASRPRIELETPIVVALYGAVLVASLLLLSWSAYSGPPSSGIELNVMNWI
jgi:hypothetical protein